MNLKKIPYGISDYRTLVNEGYLYVDKTKYIETLEQASEPFIIFLRPRRFGKSLFTSILDYYYDINSKGVFDSLFGSTYIGKNPTPKRNSYYILKFNFSGITTTSAEYLVKGFKTKILTGLRNFESKYGLSIEYSKHGLPSDIFEEFLQNVAPKISGSIYVLIDEYDHFANELLSFQQDVFEETISKTGFVRKWYEVLKSGTDNGLIQRMFITGVSPITLDSLTSGFNIGKNKTRDKNFNECLGFTEEEVRMVLKESLGDMIDVDKEMPILKRYYNGYLFSSKATSRIFNSDMVLYYASEYKSSGFPPEDLIDTNISSDYKKIASLFTLKNREQNYKILHQIIEGIPQRTEITAEFSLAKNFSSSDFNSLLYYLGFLTIDKSYVSIVELRPPNYVIQELFFDFFAEVLHEEAQYDIDIAPIRDSILELSMNGDLTDFLKIVTDTLRKLANRDFMRFDEKYVKIVMLTYFMMSKIYYVKSEYEVENGYIDIALLPRPGVITPYNAILEIKYIKKSDYCKELLDEKVTAAKAQLARYTDSIELSSMENLLKWVLVFSGDEVVYSEKV